MPIALRASTTMRPSYDAAFWLGVPDGRVRQGSPTDMVLLLELFGMEHAGS